MNDGEILSTLWKMQYLRERMDTLEAEYSAERDKLKNHMTEAGLEVLDVTGYRIRYRNVNTLRLNARALQAEMPEVARRFSRTHTARRLSIKAHL